MLDLHVDVHAALVFFRFNFFGLGSFIPGGLGGFRLDAVVVLVLAIQMWQQAADSLACEKNSGKYL